MAQMKAFIIDFFCQNIYHFNTFEDILNTFGIDVLNIVCLMYLFHALW